MSNTSVTPSNRKKNPIFERKIKHKIGSTLYPDKDADVKKIAKNPPFFQLYKGASFEYLTQKLEENPKAMSVWFQLVSLMDNQGAVMISQASLAEYFNVTRQTIHNHIKWLDEAEMLNIFKIGTSNVYAINGAIISDRVVTQKQNFLLFNAKVVIDRSEQSNKIKRKFFSVADTQTNPNQTNLLDEIARAKEELKAEDFD